MINTQLLHDVILALAALVGIAFALTAAIFAAPSAARPRQAPPGQPPHGGIRRDLPQDPQPEPDDVRELVLH